MTGEKKEVKKKGKIVFIEKEKECKEEKMRESTYESASLNI